MGMFNRDYDRDFDRRPTSNDLNYDTWRYRGGNRNVGGGYNARNYMNESTRPYSGGGNDSGFAGGNAGYDRGFRSGGNTGYDRDMRSVGIGYDEEYKSRWQTDAGDPFGDREAHTPIRMIRGEARGYDRNFSGNSGYDRGGLFGGNDRGFNTGNDRGFRGQSGHPSYGRDYSSNPVSYDPGYSNRPRGGSGRGFLGRNRGGYDRDSF